MRRQSPITALVASFALALLTSAPASAATLPIDAEPPIAVELRAFLTDHGVDSGTQEDLIEEYLAGEIWDSASSDSIPTSTEMYMEGSYHYTVNRYPDGSVNVLRVEQPIERTTGSEDGVVTPRAISGCSVVNSGTSSHRNGCKVDFWWGAVAMSFYASFTYVTPGYDRIKEVWGAGWSIGGACGTNQNYFGIQKMYENSSGPARARLEVQAQMCGIPYSTTFFLQLTVGAGGAQYSYG